MLMFLLPLFDPRAAVFGLPPGVVVMLGSVGLMVIGFLWLRHTFEPGPLVRGESRWRYRDRPRLQRLRQWLAEGDQSIRARPRGWWLTRLEFALAGVIAAITAALLPAAIAAFAPTFGGPGAVPLPLAWIVPLSGYAGIVFGIWWMRRIYLSPLETDPPAGWRYRDR